MLSGVESDADLVLRLRKGDQAAFAALVDRYHSRLTRFARSFTARPELAEDIAQETWLGLLRGLDGFEGRASLRTWLFQICANRARTLAAKEGRLVPVDPTDPDSPTVDPARFDAGGAWAQPPVPWGEAADDAELVASGCGPRSPGYPRRSSRSSHCGTWRGWARPRYAASWS
jgi:RNA polymerase sigma-70 factor (ECF subfamily)